jgi:molybdopterin-containing oxidoreductase family iron-sulfur binding subunit
MSRKMRNKMDRREFVKRGGMVAVGTAGACALPLLARSGSGAPGPSGGRKWGMVIDLNKCTPGCTACVDACRKENNVALHGDKRWDIHLIRKVKVKRKHPVESSERYVLLLCNHCDHPPCVQACPVKATYKRKDGIVTVDQHRCIGCRYCMIACPYNVRYFNFKENHEWHNTDQPKSTHGVVETCNFCAHRLDKGGKPACVEACEKAGPKAMVLGDLNDPASEVSQLIAANRVKGIREDLGTKPKVFYIGL